MALGFKVADIYASLSVDRDPLRQGVRDIAKDVGPDADRAGRDLGDKVGRGLAASVESWSAKIAKARRAEQVAAQGVTLAEKRLNEARAKGIGDGSRLLALEQQLERANWKLADANTAVTNATGKHAAAQRKLAESLTMVGKDLGPAAQRAGDDAGGKLALGMRMSIVRNSPLIVAAVAGGLVAGGPIVATAATGLFAGIGIVAAAQSDKVRSAWLGTWQGIREGAISDAHVIEPVLVGLADRVGGRFEAMRPRLRGIFSDAAPQIAVFADGLLDLTDNALPGFERAVANGMPVTRGFADFLAKTGTGLTGFLDRITEHAPEAGQAWSLLGDSMGTLLPILGELLGQGAELATVVLPALNGGLGLVLGVATRLGPALPAVVAGLSAMKIAQSVGGWVGGASTRLGDFASKGGVASGAAGKLSGVLGLASRAAGPLGIAVGVVSAAMAIGEQRTNDWARALMEGGNAAAKARAEMNDPSWVDGGIFATGSFEWLQQIAGWFGEGEKAASSAREEYDRMRASMTPLARAQSDVTKAQNDLSFAVDEFGPTSSVAQGAANDLAEAQAKVARIAAEEERAIRGVTAAMLDQVNQARAAVDANFAMELAIDAIEDAQGRYNDAVKENGRSSEEASDALRDLQMRYRDAGAAAAQLATSELPAAMNDQQKAIIGAKAELEYYHGILAKGVDLPPSMDEYVAKLERQVGAADGATLAAATLSAALAEVGITASTIPEEKAVRVDALTDIAIDRLEKLGLRVEQQKDGSFKVIADTAAAEGNLDKVSGALAAVDKTVAVPKVAADTKPLHAATNEASAELQRLAAQRPTPKASLDNAGFAGSWFKTMRDIGTLASQKPTPTAFMTTSPLVNSVLSSMGYLGKLHASRPTPVAGLNAAPFGSTAGWLGGMMRGLNAMRASPVATLHASTGSAEGALNWTARNRTSTVTQVFRTIGRPYSGGFGWADGGKIGDVTTRRFASGGSPRRSADGKLTGPGGPLDDLIAAITDTGEKVRVANTEWVVKGSSSRQYGDERMADVNAGTALVLSRREQRGLAGGGPAAGVVSGGAQPLAGARGALGGGVRIDRLEVNLPPSTGSFDMASREERRRIAEMLVDEIEEALIRRTRAYR